MNDHDEYFPISKQQDLAQSNSDAINMLRYFPQYSDLIDPFGYYEDSWGETPIAAPNSTAEVQADAVAGAVMGNDVAASQELMKLPVAEGEAQTDLKIPAAFDAKLNAQVGGGLPLEEQQQEKLEQHVGADLSDVRVHTDATAKALAEEVNARAFTKGKDIFFGEEVSEELLAHEVVHAANGGGEILKKEKPVTDHSRGAIKYSSPFDVGRFSLPSGTSLSGNNYWYAKLKKEYDPKISRTAYYRMAANPDEYMAVMSRVYELRPSVLPVSGDLPIEENVSIAGVDVTTGNTPYVAHYTFKYQYDTKPEVEINFNSEIKNVPIATDQTQFISSVTTVSNETKSEVGLATAFGFPFGNNLKSYFASHPEIENIIFKYVEGKHAEFKKSKNANGRVDDLIAAVEKNGTSNIDITIGVQISFSKANGIRAIALTYSVTSKNKLSEGYEQKDYIDFEIEQHRINHPEFSDKIGAIYGLESIADPNERLIAKYVAYNLFISTRTEDGVTQSSYRDTEVDQIIPIKNASDPTLIDELFYTFIFEKAGTDQLVNITVKRIGKKNDVTVGDVNAPKLTKVYGFESAYDPTVLESETTLAALRKWIIKRYPAINEEEIKGATYSEVIQKTESLIVSKCTTSNWFSLNYGLIILNAASAESRLKSVHKLPQQQTKDVKDFLPTELQLIELSLQRFSPLLISKLKDVRFMRQKVCLQPKFTWVAGLTEQPYVYNGDVITKINKSITLFDAAFGLNGSFVGGSEGINSSQVWSLTHEMGHVLAHTRNAPKLSSPEYEKTFNTFYKSYGITAPTEYSRNNDDKDEGHSTDSEFFPEAFTLFLMDPEWLNFNLSKVYLWFLYLQEKGTAPTLDKMKNLINYWELSKTQIAIEFMPVDSKGIYSVWNSYCAKKGLPTATTTNVLVKLVHFFWLKKNKIPNAVQADSLVKDILALLSKTANPSDDEINNLIP
jgi:hypothetical protein